MPKVTVLVLIGAGISLAACTETVGPAPAQRPLMIADGQLHKLVWQPSPRPREFAVENSTFRGPGQAGATSPSAWLLDNARLTFWAYRSKDQSVQINYRAPDGSWWPYLAFKVPKDALYAWPNGASILKGDSVPITITVDTVSLLLHLEPTGLVFNSLIPAQLQVWYTGANPDYDGNGVVDSTDALVEQTKLGVWVQEFTLNPWSNVTAVQSIASKLFSANLQHFSGYAISW